MYCFNKLNNDCHAGAIIEKGVGTAESKIKAFNEAGVKVAEYPTDVPSLLE